ncbi:ras guanine nucleotide exchange factor domain-containing protein [Phlyctochytrium arcticum]|nr:ras guanine nucleotide exchange factor domain-containing protein [Phlyctochytrium arcticum]
MDEVIDVVQALHEYKSTVGTCLSFRKGDILYVHIKDKTGWWDGTLGTRRGWFPSNYVASIPDDQHIGKSLPSLVETTTPQSATSFASQPSTISSPSSNTSASYTTSHHRQTSSRQQLEQTLSQLMEEAKELENEDDSGIALDVNLGPTSAAATTPGGGILVSLNDTQSPVQDDPNAAARLSEGEAAGISSRLLDVPKAERVTMPLKGWSDTEGELPPYWGRKTTPQGDVYYYNTQTNQTTYSLEEVRKAAKTTKRSTLLLMDQKEYQSNSNKDYITEAPPRFDSIDSLIDGSSANPDFHRPLRSRAESAASSNISNWIPGPQSLLPNNAKPSWEVLINNILRAISELNHAAKGDSKAKYVALTNQVVRAIRDMLSSSGTSSKETPAMQSNKQLRGHYHHIMSSLSKLVLAAKVASGLWPPPDAVNKMRYQAGQVLLAIRHFVSIAQDIPLELKPIVQSPTSDLAFPIDEFDIKGAELSDIEFAARLDSHSDAIITSIAKLVNLITQDRRISGVLIDQTRVTVTEIGQLLSLIEEIPLSSMEANQDMRARELLLEFQMKKDVLYSVVNDLVTAARTTMDEFAPPNALGTLLETTTSVLQAVEDVLMITKLVIDQKDLMEQRTLQEEAESYDDERRRDSELSILQRRAMSLTFLHGESGVPHAAGAPGGPGSLTPDGHMTGRDRTVSSPVMLRSNSSTTVGSMVKTPASTQSGPALRRPSHDAGTGTLGGSGLALDAQGNRIPRSSSSASLPPHMADPSSQQHRHDHVRSRAESMAETTTSSTPRTSHMSHSLGSVYQQQQQQNKLTKFFGEDSPTMKRANSGTTKISNKPQVFLAYDYGPDDISFNAEGQVNGGTFPALVERLTLHDQPVDPVFFTAFMMLFHQFGTAPEFFDLLTKRFTMSPPPNLSQEELKIWHEKKQTPARLRVYNAFRSWLENYWIDELDDPCLDRIHDFATGDMMEATSTLSLRLMELVQKKVNGNLGGTGTPKPARRNVGSVISTNTTVAPGNSDAAPPAPILPRSLKRITLMDLDPLELARQLTVMESKVFGAIQPTELVGQLWTKKSDTSMAIHVRQMTRSANELTSWVAGAILAEQDIKRRAAVLKHFIKVGERCHSLNNFNTLMAILSALNSSTIIRLKKTWELLSSKTKASFDALRKATDHSRNYSDYRATLKRLSGPCLPFLGVYLTDLTFTEDGNPSTRPSPSGPLINFDKYIKITRIIQEVQRFQFPYALSEVAEIRDWIVKEFEVASNKSANELYNVSLILEPRDNETDDAQKEMEAKIKMLEKAGFL